MPWTFQIDPDDAIHDWLRSLYTPYRTGLADPTVLPIENDVEWDTAWSGMRDISFAVLEQPTMHKNLGLGVHQIEFDGLYVVTSTMRWIQSGKPPVLKQMREFIVKTLHFNINPLPAVLRTTAGITWMMPIDSRISLFPPERANADFWLLQVRVATKVLNSII